MSEAKWIETLIGRLIRNLSLPIILSGHSSLF